MSNSNTKQPPLNHLNILDLTEGPAGFCTKLLADTGARVIKIEKPGGDSSRNVGPFLGDSSHPEKSLSFEYHNTNKLGITLDLGHDEGRMIFLRLIKKYDVIIESFSPGYLEKVGLGFNTLLEVNPKVILASITGFGQDGPRSTYQSCDLVASAFGGQMYVTGDSTTPPLKVYGEQSLYISSLFAAIGILLAIRKRDQTGRGELLDISIQESMAATLEHVMVRYFHDQTVPERQGGLHWSHEFNIFPCKDGFIHLSLFQQWETLVEWLAQDGMAEDLVDEKWRDDTYRRENVSHIIEVLQRWTKTHTVQELFEQGQLMRFPWAPVRSPMDLIQCPQLKARDFFKPISHPQEAVEIPYPGFPYKLSNVKVGPTKHAPMIGEDNDRIYCGELGMSRKKLERLAKDKVVSHP
jgi:benzylsuccinate CoA-transferase BbsE subunit